MPGPSPASANDHILGVYNRAPLAFERGEGVRLYSTDGEVYLDCVAGIATDALGHAILPWLPRSANRLKS